MRIKVLGCHGGQMPGKNNTAFLIDSELLLDAGTIAQAVGLGEQRRIKDVILSHAHLDHVGALPFFAVNIVSNRGDGVKIHGSPETIDAVKKHLMNGVLWPDFTAIKNFGGRPVFSYSAIKYNSTARIGKYTVKSVPVKHTVPTNGYVIGSGGKYVIYSGDTKDTDRIWAEGRRLGRKLKAIMIECSFPDKVAFLADSSFHLVPQTIAGQLKKLGSGVKPRVLVYHVKPEYLKEVKKDLKKIKGFRIEVMEEGKEYVI